MQQLRSQMSRSKRRHAFTFKMQPFLLSKLTGGGASLIFHPMTFACHSTYRPATQIVFSPRQPLENSGPMRLPFGWIPERVFPHRSYRGQEQGDREPLDFGL